MYFACTKRMVPWMCAGGIGDVAMSTPSMTAKGVVDSRGFRKDSETSRGADGTS